LKEVEGHSVEELSNMTGMNENTIKVKLFRARQKLVKAAQRLGRGTGSNAA
jgi:RNA polymerase sigma-70 factor (ECF subfamily)